MTVTALRRVTLGGSDAAAACGVDPWTSQVMLWARLTGRAEHPETEAMHFGRKLERVIWDELSERGFELLPAPAAGFRDPERKWLVGHPDGFVSQDMSPTPPRATASAEGAVLEIKTANQWAHRTGWCGEVPVAYQAQAQVYIHLTDRARCLVACLVAGSRLELRYIERDEDAIGLLLDGMERFLRYVKRDRPPPPDGSDSSKAALIVLYPQAQESKLVRLDREHWNLVRELRARKEQADTIAGQVRELENRLKAFMGDAELAISPHDTDALRWAMRHDKRVDVTALRAQRPDIAAEYEKHTTTRVFKLL